MWLFNCLIAAREFISNFPEIQAFMKESQAFLNTTNYATAATQRALLIDKVTRGGTKIINSVIRVQDNVLKQKRKVIVIREWQ